MLPTKLRFIWLSSFRGEDFLEINQSVTRIVCSGHACKRPLQTILVTDWLISKKSSPLKLLGQMNRNLVGSIYGRSSIKISYFVMIRLQAWPLQTILVTDWLISKKSSPLKLLSQMNRNLVGSIYGRSSITNQ
jgi:hypothetical protein